MCSDAGKRKILRVMKQVEICKTKKINILQNVADMSLFKILYIRCSLFLLCVLHVSFTDPTQMCYQWIFLNFNIQPRKVIKGVFIIYIFDNG
jgi:cell division protein FtsW (lipid II flippase)